MIHTSVSQHCGEQNRSSYISSARPCHKAAGCRNYSGKVRKDLAAGRCRLTSRQCRLINEVPTVILLTVVIMAVVKPF